MEPLSWEPPAVAGAAVAGILMKTTLIKNILVETRRKPVLFTCVLRTWKTWVKFYVEVNLFSPSSDFDPKMIRNIPI